MDAFDIDSPLLSPTLDRQDIRRAKRAAKAAAGLAAPREVPDDSFPAPLPVLKPRIVISHEGHPLTTSLAVAEHFGKLHKNVMRDIEKITADLPDEYRRLNFEPTVYNRPNPSGGKEIGAPMYRLTKDGFVLVAMGFTGKQALQWKIRYISAFNAMEKALHDQHERQVQTATEGAARRLEDTTRRLEITSQQLKNSIRATCEMEGHYARLSRDQAYRNRRLIDLHCEVRCQTMLLTRVDSRITGLEEFGALMAVTRLHTVDAMVLGFLLRRCAEEAAKCGSVWVELTVPLITSALNWNSTHQVAAALRRLVVEGLIRCEHRNGRRRFYYAHTQPVIDRLALILDDGGTPDSLVAVRDSNSPLAVALRKLVPVTQGNVSWGAFVGPEDLHRIRRLRGDDGSVPRPSHLRLTDPIKKVKRHP